MAIGPPIQSWNRTHVYNILPAINGKVEVMVHIDNEAEAGAWLLGANAHIARAIPPELFSTVFTNASIVNDALDRHNVWAPPGIPDFINLHPLPTTSAQSRANPSTRRNTNQASPQSTSKAWTSNKTTIIANSDNKSVASTTASHIDNLTTMEDNIVEIKTITSTQASQLKDHTQQLKAL
jgi:hypothetical protein